jgi:hypothetical protein
MCGLRSAFRLPESLACRSASRSDFFGHRLHQSDVSDRWAGWEFRRIARTVDRRGQVPGAAPSSAGWTLGKGRFGFRMNLQLRYDFYGTERSEKEALEEIEPLHHVG